MRAGCACTSSRSKGSASSNLCRFNSSRASSTRDPNEGAASCATTEGDPVRKNNRSNVSVCETALSNIRISRVLLLELQSPKQKLCQHYKEKGNPTWVALFRTMRLGTGSLQLWTLFSQ